MGDVLQVVELSTVENQPLLIADLNALVADRGYYIERDTLQITPGARQGRYSQVSGRYGGQRQVGEARDNATFAISAAVKSAAYGSVQSDLLMADAEALASAMDTPASAAAPRYLMFRPEFALPRRRTLYRMMGAADWRPRYIRNAFTGGNVMALELTVPIAPKAFGMPLDNFETFSTVTGGESGAVRFADQWTQYGGSALAASGGTLNSSGVDSANRVIALQDKRGEPASDREILIGLRWDGGSDTPYQGLGVVLKALDSSNYLAVIARNRTPAQLDHFAILSSAVAPVTLGSSFPVDITSNQVFWIRVRLVGESVAADFFNTATRPDDSTVPTTSVSGTITATLGAGAATAFGTDVPGWGGVIFERATSANWQITDYIDRPYTYRSTSSVADPVPLYDIPGTAPADAKLELYHRSGNKPRFGLVGWRRNDGGGTAPHAFGIIGAGASWGGAFTQTTGLGATWRDGDGLLLTLAAAGGLAAATRTVRFDAYPPDEFAGLLAPIAIWARCSVPSTVVTPQIATYLESVQGAAGTRVYSIDGGVAGRPVPVPSSGTAFRFFPVGVLVAHTGIPAQQTLGLELTYGPGSSGSFGIDYVICAPVRQAASSPVGKDSATYPDLFYAANVVRQFETDLSGGARLVSEEFDLSRLRPSPGLGGARLELEPGRNECFVKVSDLIPDDPVASAASEELSQTIDYHWAIQPAYRLWSDA